MKDGSWLVAVAWVCGVIAAVLTVIVGIYLTEFPFGGDSDLGPWLIVLGGIAIIALSLVSKRALQDRWPR
ncbi:MAG: hypothetical protein ACRDLB_08655 [Actinomycetota bacterium]